MFKIVLLVIYSAINALFVFKYSLRITEHNSQAAFLYLLLLTTGITCLYSTTALNILRKLSAKTYWWIIGVFSTMFIMTLLIIDPDTILVTRYAALNEWIGNVLHGVYPYGTEILPSGFPGLFILAFPFYLLGDVGYMQIFSFILFGWLVYRKYPDNENKYIILLLLITSPIFLFEIIVRSDLFSNIVIALAMVELYQNKSGERGYMRIITAGACAGLILSTRGIILLILLPYFIYRFKNDIKSGLCFAGTGVLVFLLTVLPFYLWNPAKFIEFGSFSVQGRYIPLWIFAIILVVQAVWSAKAGSLRDLYVICMFANFTVILTAFLLEIGEEGFFHVIYQGGFDISYFIFPLPFLLLLIPEKSDDK